MSIASPNSPPRPFSSSRDEHRSPSTNDTQPSAANLDPFVTDDPDDEPHIPTQVTDQYGTPPFPTSPRLDPSSPRNFSTISSLAGSRELGRPVLEPITQIFTASPSVPALQSGASMSLLPDDTLADETAPDGMEVAPTDVTFHAKPQGLMQMLSLVGSTFFEADREGFTEDEAEELDRQLAPTNRAERGRECPESAPMIEGQQQPQDLRRYSFDPTSAFSAKGRLQALARDDGSDDGFTPQGGRSPLDASVLTIGPSRPERSSLAQSDILGLSRDPTATKGGRRPSNLRSQLHNVESASTYASTSRLGDPTDARQTPSSPLQEDSIDSPGLPSACQGSKGHRSTAHLLSQRRLDPLLIRPYPDPHPSGEAQADKSELDRDRLIVQLKEVFQLDAAEILLLAQPCWLFRSLLLQGHLYLTSGHVCFYAYLPSRDEKVIKTGMLGKRTRRTHRFSKHWASLKGGKLSWFDSDRDPYFPQGHIDLRKVSAIEPSQNHKERFKVTTPARRFTFLAEDEHSRDAWIVALQKQTFRAQNQGDSVRISIPLETIMNVETTLSVDGTEMVCITVVDEAGDFSIDEYYFLHLTKPSAFISSLNSVLDGAARGSGSSPQSAEQDLNFSRLSIRDSTGAAHASALSRKSLEEVPTLSQVHVSARAPDGDAGANMCTGKPLGVAPSTAAQEKQLKSDEIQDGPQALGPTTATAIAVPTSIRRKPQDAPTEAVLSTTPRAAMLNRLSMESAHTYPPSPSISDPSSSFDQVQREAERGWAIPNWLKSAPAKVLGRAADGSSSAPQGKTTANVTSCKRRRKVVERWSDDKTDSASREASSATDTEDDLLSQSIHSARSNYSMLDANEAEDEQVDNTNVAAEFRDTFGIFEEEGLIGHTHAYLYRVLPVAGRFFVSEHHLAFRSSGIAAKTVGRTLMLVPLQDVISAAKHVAFRPGHHGMVINISGHEELFLEISSGHRRDELLSLIEYQLELERGGRGSRASREAVTRERSNALVLRDLSERITDGPATASLTSSADSTMLSPIQSGLRNSGSLSQLGDGSHILSFAPATPLTFTMLTIGSRGDVQPYIALAKALQADGHRVRIATHAEFGDWIMGHDIEFSEIGGDPAELMRICVENGTFTVSFLREGVTRFRDWLDDLLASAWRACQGSDVIIECPSAIAGIHVAEALQVPYFRAFTMPWTRTRAYPHAFAVPNKKAGGNYNYMSYVIFDQMFWRASSFQINRWRKNLLALKPTSFDKLEQHKVPFIYNFSPSLVPRPLDWFEWIHVTGFWFLDNPDNSSSKKWEPPADLVAFIQGARERSRKLVYIGWGSIVVPDAETMTRCVLQAVQKAGVCAILSKGWSDRLSSDPKKGTASLDPSLVQDVFQVSSVPHDWLFPQIDAACHHGGAGTLGASLRAGLPTVVKPYFGDQFFWGQQIESLGVGSCVRRLTADNLAEALVKATSNVKQIEKARKLGEQIRGEDGLGNAVKAIYRDLDYARSLVKRNTRLVTESSAPNAARETVIGTEADKTAAGAVGNEEAKPGVETKTTKQQLGSSDLSPIEDGEDGGISDEWSDIGGGPLSPSREEHNASLVFS
ncbi:probable UDP-glucose:sterol glucosyltransferase [Melanopsichium pennsylvanicum]|uniref:Sterol 3-beta-glucosyltransferase n=2 Tax=Melanopsichium pennsylvanicum TaxID=63383 RepID=A0AAJ4XPM2_9BASI|nr:UDP-glucose:sterol glucosyltransferase [Melanopsichium pennsylvanicum 4]SNX85601.1 probable UDP-glucose:sterol glucosyltransferase [Melanopsichium pennsylvanicum]